MIKSKNFIDQNVVYSDDLSYNKYWNIYSEINSLFASQIAQIKESEEDLIWVNDIHLLLVPWILRN